MNSLSWGSRAIAGVLFVLAGCLAPGCSSDRAVDHLTNPGGTTDPFGEETAEAIGLSTLQLLNDLIILLPDWTSGDLGGIGGTRPPESVLHQTAPHWNDAEKSWAFDDSLVVGSTSVASRYRYGYLVRYDQCDHWQREALGADQMSLRIDLTQNGSSQSGPGELGTYSIVYAYRYWVTGEASELRSATREYHGQGGMSGDYTMTSSSGVSHSRYSSSYEAYITLGAGGCPAGSVVIDLDPFQMYVTYSGTPRPSWVLKRGIATISSGTGSIACGY